MTFPPFRSPARRGMALLISLGMVTLLTVLVLAFFFRAKLDRQISFSSINLFKADELARSSLDVIVGELRDEITDAAHSTGTASGGLTLYQPLTTADWLPRSLGVSGATGSLLKVSASGVAIRSGGTITGSSVAISSASANGRSLSASRWFTSATASPQLGSQGTLPTWLFVTRANGVKTPAIADAKTPSSKDYVIGRFAYTVYDTGGLFDATLAGCPAATPFATPAADVGLKASAAYVDLSLFGFTSSKLDNFYSWRNPLTGTGADAPTFLEWAAGIRRASTAGTVNPAALSAAQSGHLLIAAGDNTPLSRHDLLANPNLTEAPATLTHFSRTLNAPSAIPSTVSATNPNLGTIRFAGAASITHYRDDGATDTYPVVAGDLLLQHRFSLGKLAWLTYKGPSADLSTGDSLYNAAGTDAAILACFGLQWKTNLTIGLNANVPCWQYTAVDAAGKIKTLATVAGENREPNFLELLKAGILVGSLGKTNDTGLSTLANPTNQTVVDANQDLQVLRIGACAIDSADADNYPTTITLTLGGANIPVRGIEDLPYLYSTSSSRINDDTYNKVTNQHVSTYYSCILMPWLFNPHQASPSAATVGPGSLRFRVVKGTLNQINPQVVGYTGGPTVNSFYTTFLKTTSASLTGTPAIVVPSASFANFRATTKPIRSTDTADSSAVLSTIIPGFTTTASANATATGFLLWSYVNPALPPLQYTYTFAQDAQRTLCVYVTDLQIVSEYLDANNVYRVYDNFGGNDGYTSSSGLGGTTAATSYLQMCIGYTAYNDLTTTVPPGDATKIVSQACSTIGYGESKIDPRTNRFGIVGNSNLNILNQTMSNTGVTTVGPFYLGLPFGPNHDSSPPLTAGQSPYVGDWFEGGKTGWTTSVASPTANTNVADPDGVARPADAYLSGTSANLFRNLATPACRPVILQRPFRSVAELGQVFRDNPGKTLNFFDTTSGDKGLLDLFSVCDEPAVAAGRVQLNTTQTKVQQALFTNAGQTPAGATVLTAPAALATAYNAYAFSGGVPTSTMPTSPANVADFLSSLPVGGADGLSAIKYQREAVARSLANTTQTRTWNLLVDVVAQTGHYTTTATVLDNFIVEGERRYWLSLAIDRLTGKVIDRQLEPASN